MAKRKKSFNLVKGDTFRYIGAAKDAWHTVTHITDEKIFYTLENGNEDFIWKSSSVTVILFSLIYNH